MTRRSRRGLRRLPSSWKTLTALLLLLSAYEFVDAGTVTWPQDALRAVREFVVGLQAPTEPALPADGTPAYDLSGRVIAVADGDTFTLRLAGQRDFRVRLFGIDSPERNQPHGRAAGQMLSDYVLGKDVFLILEDADNYGRLVATVYVEGQNMNLTLVEQGLAWWYRDFAPAHTELDAAQVAAQRAQRGLWRDPAPVAPWEWRRR